MSVFWRMAAATLCVLALTANFTGYALLDPDEGRNAEVAREMAVSGDFVVPQLNGLPYVDKPVLYFATGAIAIKLFGATVFAARLPSLMFTLITLAVVAWFGRQLFGPEGAWIAAIATAATPFTLAYARTVIFDSALTSFVVISLVAFYQAIDGDGERRGWWSLAAWAALAFGVLTKGPIALVLPLMIVVPYALLRRAVRAVFEPLSMLAFIALVFPWVLAMERRVPEFLSYVLVTETWQRLTTDELRRTGPLWYFLAILPAAALPWSLTLLGIARRPRSLNPMHWDKRMQFLAAWIILPLAFFSLSQSKRPQYVLPLIPALGLLVSGFWSGNLMPITVAAARMAAGIRAAGLGLLVMGAFLLTTHAAIPSWMGASDAVADAIPGTAIGLGLVTALSGALAILSGRRREIALCLLCIPVAAIPLVSRQLMAEIGHDRSAAPIAHALEPYGASVEVVAIRSYPLSLPFYLEQPLVLVTLDGSELTSTYLERHFANLQTSRWIRPPGSWRDAVTACARPTVFVTSADDRQTNDALREQLNLLTRTRKFRVYGPCGVATLARDRR